MSSSSSSSAVLLSVQEVFACWLRADYKNQPRATLTLHFILKFLKNSIPGF